MPTWIRLALAALVLASGPSPAAGRARQSPEPPDEVVLGKPSNIRSLAEPAETVLIAAGTRLYALPDRRSALIDIVGVEAPRPVLERAAGWVLVRAGSRGGWAAVAAGRTGPAIEAPPDLEYLARRSEPLTPRRERLARARSLLRREVARPVGPFTLYTDLEDGASIERLVAVVSQLPAVYARRYGVKPAPRDRFAVIVFADESSYRAFEQHDFELLDLQAGGHAAGNVAALYAEGRRRPQLGPILLHELTHLLNRSVFRGALPAWLEEGMAEDLSYARIERSGRLDPQQLGGVDRRYFELSGDGSGTHVTELWGAPASLSRLVEATRGDGLMALPDLMALSRREMMRHDGRSLRYGQSAFLVRYLLEGAGDAGRTGLHRLLRQAAEGSGLEPNDLCTLVGRSCEELTRQYERWLVARAREAATG